ncbi:uncharacterized protein [Diabrotica undecimpunctata]|uniref:uncharacterized protein n=1 Tax=Diabrotica undecimpunctata TaxID=50387 RepID=UPI003B6321EE
MRKNKREILKEFLPIRNRVEHSSVFGIYKYCVLVSYFLKKNKAVVVVSTLHSIVDIDESTGDKNKLEIVTFYNMTKVGVDLVDQLCQHNNVAGNIRHWPMVLFYNLANIFAINALCIYRYHHHMNEKIPRVRFLQNLSWQLIKPQIERRSQNPNILRQLRQREKKLLGIKEDEQPAEAKPGSRKLYSKFGK